MGFISGLKPVCRSQILCNKYPEEKINDFKENYFKSKIAVPEILVKVSDPKRSHLFYAKT